MTDLMQVSLFYSLTDHSFKTVTPRTGSMLSSESWTEPCLYLCPLTAFTSRTWNPCPRHLRLFSASPKPTHNCNLCLLLIAIELFIHKAFSLLYFQPEVLSERRWIYGQIQCLGLNILNLYSHSLTKKCFVIY